MPQDLHFINLHGLLECYHDPRLVKIKNILKLLKSKNLIDVFYLQLRYVGYPNLNPANPPSREDLKKLADRIYAETGVPVMFIEVGIKGNGDIQKIFSNTTGACMDSPVCLGIQINSVFGAGQEEPISIFSYGGNNPPPNSGYYGMLTFP
ncbi:MAG: hypothetical protein IT316_07960 [Anaerolineales bacterium]|nr:hypothetical protein [Anaerolineales bacterium]